MHIARILKIWLCGKFINRSVLGITLSTGEKGNYHPTLVILPKYIMYPEKPIPVGNFQLLRFVGGTTNYGSEVNTNAYCNP